MADTGQVLAFIRYQSHDDQPVYCFRPGDAAFAAADKIVQDIEGEGHRDKFEPHAGGSGRTAWLGSEGHVQESRDIGIADTMMYKPRLQAPRR